MRILAIGFVAALMLLNMSGLQAQTGLLISPERYRDMPALPTYTGQKFNDVPLKVSLKKYCPVPGDQGKVSACVGWAVGYGALTILRAQRLRITDPALITQDAYSAAFIYNQIKIKPDDCTPGAYIEDALALLRDQGDCMERQFNYQKTDCKSIPFGSVLEEAAQHRIIDFATVFDLDEPGKNKIAKACKVLATQMPLVVGMAISPSFSEVKPGASMWSPAEQEPLSSYHAMVLVGYDNVERRFELMNSFGPGWGQGGFIKIKYEDFERLCRYAYVIMPDEAALAKVAGRQEEKNAAIPTPLSGSFVFRTPGGYVVNQNGDEIPYFEEVATRRNDQLGIYETVQAGFPVGDVFQLVAREIPRGRYVYVFSRSPGGKLQWHFPKSTATGGKMAGFVLEKTAEIVIPGEETVLQLPAPGADWLCLLFCERALPDMEQRLLQLDARPEPFPDAVQQVFGDVLIPANRVQYDADRMEFTAIADPKHLAVPLILRVLAE